MKRNGDGKEFRKVDFERPSWLFRFCMAVIRPLLTGPLLFRPFVESLDLSGTERVLELGCGNGVCLAYVARALDKGGAAVGIDTSSYMVERARKRLENFPNAKVFHGDLRTLGMEEGSFDRVIFVHVLHDIEPEARLDTVKALARLLKPFGRISLLEPTSPSHGMAPHEIRKILEEAGFTDILAVPMGRRVKVSCRKT